MATREEISSGTHLIINNHTRGKLTPSERRNLRDALLEYEHSQGVVVKVDRESPKLVPDDASHDYGKGYAMGERQFAQTMLDAGYVAVEPLIEESE